MGVVKVSDAIMDAINIAGDDFRPEWNYLAATTVDYIAIVFESVLS